MKIIWSPLAIDRADEIVERILVDNEAAAEKWLTTLLRRVQRLGNYPKSGRIVPEIERRDIREILHGTYRVIYRFDAARVTILTIRHSRRLLNPEAIET
jgi:toxin ParE1/3/4